MEKDSKDSSSDEGKNTENRYFHDEEFELSIIEQQRLLYRQVELMRETLDRSEKQCQHVRDLVSCAGKMSDGPRLDLAWPVSPIQSPIYEHNSLHRDVSKYISYPPFLGGSAEQPTVLRYPKKELRRPWISDDATLADGTDSSFDAPEAFKERRKRYAGKGKGAANPKFRYKKRAKPDASSADESPEETPAEHFKKPFGTTETKTPESQSLDTMLTGLVKKALKRSHSDESSTRISELSESPADGNDDSTIAKKLKFSDDETPSKQCPYVATLLSQSNYNVPKSTDQSKTDQASIESEQLNLPSTSGMSKVISYVSSSEDSYHFSGYEDVTRSERGESSVTSGSGDVTPTERGESSRTSGSGDVPPSERGESSRTSGSEDVTPSERGESSRASGSTDGPAKSTSEEDCLSVFED